MNQKCHSLHKFSLSIHLFSAALRLRSIGIDDILVYIYLPWHKSWNGSGGIQTNGGWSASFMNMAYFLRCYYYSHLLSITNIQYRRGVLLRVASERDNRKQYWIAMVAVVRHDTIKSPSVLIHLYCDFCLNIGCLSSEKVLMKSFLKKFFATNQEICATAFSTVGVKGWV